MASVSELHVAKRQDFLAQPAFSELYERADQLARMLSGLRNNLR